MAITFPTSLDSLTNPTASDKLNSVSVPHATQHSDVNDAIEALEAKVGVDGSAVATSHDYKISAVETDVTNINELQRNTQTGTSYTLVLGDAGKLVERNNASPNTLTIPPNSSVAFPTGTQILVTQLGAGTTTLAAGAGVTIRSKDSNLAMNGRYTGVTLIKRGTDEWYAIGDLT